MTSDPLSESHAMTITETTTIGDIAATRPSSVRIFQRHGIDFCCGGKRTLAAVCRDQQMPFTEIAAAIEASAVATADDRDWATAPAGALIDHIVATYHDALREDLPRLEAMASKVARVHGAKAAYLAQIREIVTELSSDLRAHMHKEEAILFPALRGLDGGATDGAWLAAPIAVMEHEHDRAGALLADLRRLTSHYEPPAWACATFRALYQGLAELEASMHLHVHLENNVLFPRALSGASPLRTSATGDRPPMA
jgi:regulator of cell morphogenesis and NO signaling